MSKDFLWAPWRMDYISNPDKEQNIFIKKAKSKNDRDNLVLYRAKKNFIIDAKEKNYLFNSKAIIYDITSQKLTDILSKKNLGEMGFN